MADLRAWYTSRTEEWATPVKVFEELDREFHFTLDPCSSPLNYKCEKHYTIEDDGLMQDWGGETVFCNPPYGKAMRNWVAKCALEAGKPGTTVVMLIPARTDTSYFHDYIYHKADEIRFLRGRFHFNDGKNPAPFPSMIVIFKSKEI